MMYPWTEIAKQISNARATPFTVESSRGSGGGCINASCIISGDGQRYFVKLNDAQRLPMFIAEFEGLEEIRRSGSLRVPVPVCHGSAEGYAFIVMECLDLSGGGRGGSEEDLGRRLAAMHRVTEREYGWHIDNTIGSTPQPNRRQTEWLRFWREQRLGFQLELAASNGYRGRLQQIGGQLLDVLPALLPERPPASLLHGDLWSGNYAFTDDGSPVIFDPAVYYGDRETDIAMTELFGGFPAGFYRAYQEAWPLDPGYRTRKTLYNLYHVLNHLNLFGGGYQSQAEAMIGRLLSESR